MKFPAPSSGLASRDQQPFVTLWRLGRGADNEGIQEG